MWKKMRHGVRNRLLSGVLLFVPFGVALLVVRWLFRWLSGFLQPEVKEAISTPEVSALFKSVPETYVTIGVSVLSILILLFFALPCGRHRAIRFGAAAYCCRGEAAHVDSSGANRVFSNKAGDASVFGAGSGGV
jgi:hypothetical protein